MVMAIEQKGYNRDGKVPLITYLLIMHTQCVALWDTLNIILQKCMNSCQILNFILWKLHTRYVDKINSIEKINVSWM